MHKVWIIARHEYLTNLRRTGFIVWTLAVPLLGALGLVVAAFFGGQAANFLHTQFVPEKQQTGIVDQSGLFTPIAPQHQEQFVAYADRETGQSALAEKEIDSLLVIPADYLESGQVLVVARGGNVNIGTADGAEKFLVEELLAHSRIEPAIAERVLRPMDPVVVRLDASGAAEEPDQGGLFQFLASVMVPYFLGILLVMTIFTSSGYLLRGVAEEKSTRVIEIMLSSVSAWQLLAGKVAGLGALGLTQIAVWLGSAVVLSGGAIGLIGIAIPLLTQPGLLALCVVYYLLGFLIFAMLMGAGGALGTTQQESQQIAGMFSFMAAVPLMIVGFIMTNPNATIARVLSWFPLTAPTMMMIRVALTEVPMLDIVGSIAVCVITIPFLVWAGGKVFRFGLLMYGKRPSVGEVFRLLRQA